MSFLKRFRALPYIDLFFFIPLTFLFYTLHRYAEPVPGSLFYPGFFLQFFLGFVPQLYQRKWGRILTATAALVTVRISAFTGLESLGSYQLVGLFMGSVLGIWTRETILVLLGRGEMALPKQSDHLLVDWMIRNPTGKAIQSIPYSNLFGLLCFLLFLLVLSFLKLQGFGLLQGLGFQESMYFGTLSSREAFGFVSKILVSLGFVVLYFFSEERNLPTPSKDSLLEQLRFGILVGLTINILVFVSQSIWGVRFFGIGTGESLVLGRSSGFFTDSGSSSWILPVLSLLFIGKWVGLYRKTKERFLLLLVFSLICLVSFLGFTQGKAFWLVWVVPIWIGIIHITTDIFIPTGWKKQTTRIGLYILSPISFWAIFYGISLLTFDVSLVVLAKRMIGAVSVWKHGLFQTLISLDLTRAELIQIGWEGFLKHPWVGNGIASFPLEILDPNRIGTKLTLKFVDFPPNFFLFLLHDLGILGSLIFVFLISILVWERQTGSQILLLLLPFLFGVQIQHAEGAFVFAYLLLFPERGVGLSFSFEKYRRTIWFSPLLLILFIGLPINFVLFSSQNYITQGVGADFRKSELGEYQLGASFPATAGSQFHEFHGTIWEWKLGTVGTGNFTLFTEGKNNQLEFHFYNVDHKLIQKVLCKETGSGYVWNGAIPGGAAYVRLTAKKRIQAKIPKSHFDSANRLLL
ncbi:hypothetical protein P3G55_07015 [Leptospira sp. 96542]|nr:hypothetical protein [Leptospira sp. 96542]